MITIMPATKEQLHYFAQHIRKADAKEVFHATGIYDRTHLYVTLCHLKGVMAVTLSDGSLLGIGGIETLNERRTAGPYQHTEKTLSAYKNTAYVLLGGALCKAWQLIFSCFSLCALVKRCLLC